MMESSRYCLLANRDDQSILLAFSTRVCGLGGWFLLLPGWMTDRSVAWVMLTRKVKTLVIQELAYMIHYLSLMWSLTSYLHLYIPELWSCRGRCFLREAEGEFLGEGPKISPNLSRSMPLQCPWWLVVMIVICEWHISHISQWYM